MTIGPKASAEIKVHLNLLKIAAQQPERNRWPLSVFVQASLANSSDHLPMTLSGEIVSPLAKLPSNSAPQRVVRTAEPTEKTFGVDAANGVSFVGVSSPTKGVACSARKDSRGHYLVGLLLNPAELDEGVVFARTDLRFSGPDGQALPPLSLEFPLLVSASVLLDPQVLLLGARGTTETVTLRGLDNREFKVLEISKVDGVDATLISTEAEYASERSLSITAKPSQEVNFRELKIDVASRNAKVREQLTLWIQPPTLLPGSAK